MNTHVSMTLRRRTVLASATATTTAASLGASVATASLDCAGGDCVVNCNIA